MNLHQLLLARAENDQPIHVALIGAGNAFAIARWAGAFMLRRRLASSALLGLVGGAGVFGSGLFGSPGLDIAALIGQAFA